MSYTRFGYIDNGRGGSGERGLPGAKGDDGPQGPSGPQGPPGPLDYTQIPAGSVASPSLAFATDDETGLRLITTTHAGAFTTDQLSIHYRAHDVDGLGGAGSSSTTGFVNLANPGTYDAVLHTGSSPVFSSVVGVDGFETVLTMDSANTYLEIQDGFVLEGGTNQIVNSSLEFWVKLNATADYRPFYGEEWTDSGHVVRHHLHQNDDTSNVHIDHNSATGTYSPTVGSGYPTVGEYVQMVYTKSGSTCKLYIDGIQVGSSWTSDRRYTWGDDDVVAVIGRHWGKSMQGDLAIVRIYDKALSAVEVSNNYITETAGGLTKHGVGVSVNGVSRISVEEHNLATVVDTGVLCLPDGSGADPSICFDTDRDTGLYRVSNDALGISAGGSLQCMVANGAITVLNDMTVNGSIAIGGEISGGVLKPADGTALLPALAWDSNTGVYRPGTGRVGISTNGIQRVDVADSLFSVSTDTTIDGTLATDSVVVDAGTALLPSIAFDSDPDTGLYHIGADNIGASVGGVKKVDVDSTRTLITQDTTINGSATVDKLELATGGSFTNPVICLDNGDTGIWSSGDNTFNITVGGGTKIAMTTAETKVNNTFKISDYSFPTSDGDAGTILQTDGAGSLSFVTPLDGANSTSVVTVGDGTNDFTMDNETVTYRSLGKLTMCYFDLRWTAIGSASGDMLISLPFTVAVNALATVGFFQNAPSSTDHYTGRILAGTNYMRIQNRTGSYVQCSEVNTNPTQILIHCVVLRS